MADRARVVYKIATLGFIMFGLLAIILPVVISKTNVRPAVGRIVKGKGNGKTPSTVAIVS